jgi:hypothetical protein
MPVFVDGGSTSVPHVKMVELANLATLNVSGVILPLIVRFAGADSSYRQEFVIHAAHIVQFVKMKTSALSATGAITLLVIENA